MADLKKERDKDENESSQSGQEKDRRWDLLMNYSHYGVTLSLRLAKHYASYIWCPLRFSEPPKIPKLKISLKLATKDDKDTKEVKEPRVKQITALSDDLTIEKKIKVVIFALQNSTQKAAEHFNLRAGDVHSFMSQVRLMKKITIIS